MLLLFLFCFCVFVCVCVCVPFFDFCFFLTRDSNMISIGTVEFRHVAIIIPVNLGKP